MAEHRTGGGPGTITRIPTAQVRKGGITIQACKARELKRSLQGAVRDAANVTGDKWPAVGDGVIDVAAIAAASRAAWHVVELDRCATDMLEAVEKSHRFLTEGGFAVGRS